MTSWTIASRRSGAVRPFFCKGADFVFSANRVARYKFAPTFWDNFPICFLMFLVPKFQWIPISNCIVATTMFISIMCHGCTLHSSCLDRRLLPEPPQVFPVQTRSFAPDMVTAEAAVAGGRLLCKQECWQARPVNNLAKALMCTMG